MDKDGCCLSDPEFNEIMRRIYSEAAKDLEKASDPEFLDRIWDKLQEEKAGCSPMEDPT